MQAVEQATIIEAPFAAVMKAVNNIEGIPEWATVQGTVIKRPELPDSYEWHFKVGNLSFEGELKVVEQTENSLLTRTTGDVDSIWTINVTAVGKRSTAIQIVVEYTLTNALVEPLADLVVQQLTSPEVAKENMRRFKVMVEELASLDTDREVLTITKLGNV